MLEYVKCPECNELLSHKYEAFEKMRYDKYTQSLKGQLPTNNTNLDIDLTDIFKKLNITKNCCKMHLNTATLLVDELKQDLLKKDPTKIKFIKEKNLTRQGSSKKN